jgi:hypothetical protein
MPEHGLGLLIGRQVAVSCILSFFAGLVLNPCAAERVVDGASIQGSCMHVLLVATTDIFCAAVGVSTVVHRLAFQGMV